MKNLKKLLAIVIAVALLLCSVPMVASAAFTDPVLEGRSDFLWGTQFHTPYWSANYSTDNIAEQVEAAYEMGVKLIRVDGNAPEGHLEELLSLCNEYGIKVLLIGYIPDFDVTQPCADTNAVASSFTTLLNKYSGYVDYIQIHNEMDLPIIEASGLDNPPGTAASEYNSDILDNAASYVSAAIQGVNAADVVPQIVINFSYTHYGMLEAFEARGIDWDVTGHDWYSDMISTRPDYNDLANLIASKWDKPILVAEVGQRPTQELVNSEDTDASAAGYDQLITMMSQMYANENVIGASVYEFVDEPEREEGTFNSEAHYGLVKYVDGEMVKKPIYNRISAMLPDLPDPILSPEMVTDYEVLDSISGKINSTTVPAGVEMYASVTHRMLQYFRGGYQFDELSTVEYIELDVYVSTAVEANKIGFWISNECDAAAVRGKVNLPALEAGWNHIVIDIAQIGGNGGFSFTAYDKWNSIFWEGSPSSTEDVTIAYANIALTTSNSVPTMNNTNEYVLASQEGVFWSKDGIAPNYTLPPVGADNNATWYGHLSKSYDASGAEYLEMDVYSNVEIPDARIWVSSAAWADAGRARMSSVFELNAGWTHVIVDMNKLDITSGSLNKSDVKNIFLEFTTPSSSESISLKMANLAFTTNNYVPEMNNTYSNIVASQKGLFWSKSDIAPNYSMPPFGADNNASWYGSLSAPLNTTGADYLEMDVYSNVEVPDAKVWVSSAAWADSGRARMETGVKLNAGWTHVIVDMNKLDISSGVLDRTAVKNIYLEFTTPDAEGNIELKMANLAFTNEVPAMNNTHSNAVYKQDGKFISRTYNRGQSTMDWSMGWDGIFYYDFDGNESTKIDVSEAEYLEFDMYASAAMPESTLIVTSGHGENAGRKGTKLPALNAGWNHICIPMSDIGNDQGNSETPEAPYDTSALNAFYVYNTNVQPVDAEVNSVEFAMANLAFTNDGTVIDPDEPFEIPEAPAAGETYENVVIDYDTGVFEKTWEGDVTNTYVDPIHGTDSRLFIGLNDPIDVTKAEYLEFDIWVSAPMQDMGIWLCNDFDYATEETGRAKFNVTLSDLNVREWNHVVVSLTNVATTAGTFHKDNWTSLFFEGDPNAPGVELTISVANFGVTKSYPDMNNTHFLVDTAIDGIAANNTANTVPAGAGMYPNYQMWNQFDPVDMTDVDYIEMDVYVSAPMESTIRFHTHVDSAAVRGFWTFPKLETAGWHHVVIDVVNDYAGSNSGFQIADLTSWNGYFFEGTPSSSNEITFKVANVACTKFSPYPRSEYFEATTHPEIDGDGTFVEGGKMRWDADGYVGNYAWYIDKTNFTKTIDFNKGDFIEFDVYLGAKADKDIVIRFGNDAIAWTSTARASAWIKTSEMQVGWNHVVIPISELELTGGVDVSAIKGFFFDGTLLNDTAAEIRFAFTNFALTVQESEKADMVYTGKVISRFNGYENVTVPAASNVQNAAEPILLPTPMDLTDIDYIEMNLYVTAKCSLTFYLNATPVDEGGMFDDASAYYTLENLSFGWNQVKIPVAELTANVWFDPAAVYYIFFSGVPATTYDVTFGVESLAATSESQAFDIVAGDYNVDNAVNILDLIHVKNELLAENEGKWFANAAEAGEAADGVLNALDFTALRKLLFESF